MNQSMFDGWTVAHVLAGVLAAEFGWSLRSAIVGALVYEVAEQYVERTEVGRVVFGSDGPESARNVFGDMLAFTVGYVLVR